jgi:hypothetical protein
MTGDPRQARIDEQAVPVLHQGMPDEAQPKNHV